MDVQSMTKKHEVISLNLVNKKRTTFMVWDWPIKCVNLGFGIQKRGEKS